MSGSLGGGTQYIRDSISATREQNQLSVYLAVRLRVLVKCIINVLPTDANSNQMGVSNTTDHRIFAFLSLLSFSSFSFSSFSLRFFAKKKRSQQPCRIHLSFTFPFSLGALNLAMCTPVSLKGKERNSQVSQLPVACARSRISVLVDRNTYRPFSRTMFMHLV